ncbi:MAG: diguanylate cyclase [Thermoanaerobaculia bacterium]|nr:diguanylate cyclase [Thermoanaerobaculia bacterium]
MKLSAFQPLSWPYRLKLLAAVLVPLLPVLFPLVGALAAFEALVESEGKHDLAANRMQHAEEALRMLFEANAATRGFVITGEPELLRAYESLDGRMPAALAELRELVFGDAVQSWRARRASELYTSWRTDVAEPIVRARTAVQALERADPRRRAMLDLIEARIALGEGTRLTNAFSDVVQHFNRAERVVLLDAQRQVGRQRSALRWLAFVGVPLAVLTGVAMALLLARRATRSLAALADAASQIERGDLPEPIAYVGRDELTWLARAFNRMIAKEAVRRDERAALAALDELLQSSGTLEEAAGVVATFAPRLLPAASGGLYFYDASRCELERVAAFGDDASIGPAHFVPDRCWAIRLAKPYRALAAHDPRCSHDGHGEGAAVCIPLAAHGEIFGLFTCSLQAADAAERPDWVAVAEDLGERLALQFAALRLREDLRNQSIRDPLTSVFNRRYFDETFERELRRAERAHKPLSLLLIDLDHFKRFNDTYGHEAGDLVLREFGALLGQVFRAGDLPCRLGGEEFAVLLPESDLAGIRHRVEELSMRLRNRDLRLRKQPLGRVTMSAGLAEFPTHGHSAQELLRAADEALYAAKNAGRDRYLIAS